MPYTSTILSITISLKIINSVNGENEAKKKTGQENFFYLN